MLWFRYLGMEGGRAGMGPLCICLCMFKGCFGYCREAIRLEEI